MNMSTMSNIQHSLRGIGGRLSGDEAGVLYRYEN